MAKALGVAAFGARGTGKTTWVVQYIRAQRFPRLVIWDYKHDPTVEGLGTPVRSIPELIKAMQAKTFQIRYLVNHNVDLELQFEYFCRAVWMVAFPHVAVYVAEVPEVTRANMAPRAWRKIINVGREFTNDKSQKCSITYIGDAQRAEEVDKSFINNADIIHCGRMANLKDAKNMAQFMNCNAMELMQLPDYHWIERRAGQIEPVRGVLPPPKSGIPAKKVASKQRAKKAA